jgi:endonuclease/exonuclease/phosphatase family metal-dependent hydrolase
MESGRFRVVSWNLHKGRSPDRTGARPQMAEIVAELRRARADAYLLQEVTPWQARQLVAEMGMPGYYSSTLSWQGNLVLVHPGLAVDGDTQAFLNVDTAPGDWGKALRVFRGYMTRGPRHEPRSGQALQVRLPDGRGLTLWNTHLSAREHHPGERQEETVKMLDLLDRLSGGNPVVGGGDLNDRAGSPVLAELAARGYEAQGARIDWIALRGLPPGSMHTRHYEVRTPQGLQVSDHPLVVSELTL